MTTVDLRTGEWPGMEPDGQADRGEYLLKRHRLDLELVDETRYGGLYSIRYTISIDGAFQSRRHNRVTGPFSGTATLHRVRRHFSTELQDWVEEVAGVEEGTVIGHCLLDGVRVTSLPIGSSREGSVDLFPAG